jgi:putative ATP-dependent endonuclease of OLD family
MKLSKLHVRNYRALRDVEIPLSNFVCLTGENNAGKSSVLQALSLFASGAKLASTNFFDAAVEVTITLTLSDVQKEDLSRLIVDEHRKRIETLVKNNTLELVRSFAPDGTSKLGHYTLLPKDARFRPEEVTKCLKGKKGKEIPLILGKTFPELAKDPNSAVKLLSATTQDAAKELIDELAQSLSADQKQKAFASLPTGGGFTLTPLLPEVIYIPAVKDLADDVKTTESSSFGKILGIVLDDVIPLLKSEADLFSKLRAKLNRVSDEFGKMKDDRLDDLKFIETEMQGFVRESFRSVTLEMEIPPPKLESIFSTARILVDDGTKGSLDTKGDGLRRAVVFAILRTYVTLVAKKAQAAQSNRTDESGDNQRSPGREKSYLLLYEEPELFLHPDAQRLLFEALGAFSVQHHVVVTTHSPLFLGPEATATFIRLSKGQENNCPKPFSKAHPIDLSELAPKDEFQMICFENNNAAFFSRTVVLVEGDSDQIVFPHIARVLDPEWICSRHSLAFVKIHGKGS